MSRQHHGPPDVTDTTSRWLLMGTVPRAGMLGHVSLLVQPSEKERRYI